MLARKAIQVGLMLALLTGAGCGERVPPLIEVEGVVLLDGNPLAGVLVEFVPDDAEGHRLPFSNGQTDDNGRYQLRCENDQPGAVLGPHKVTIRRPSVRPAPDAPPPAAGPAIPLVYQSVLETPLTVEVRADQQGYLLSLKSD
jgi:hypothetical protein